MQMLYVALIIVVIAAAALARSGELHYPTYLKFAFLQTGVLALWLAWTAQNLLRPREPEAGLRPWARARLPEVLLVAFVAWAALSVTWSGMPYVALLGLIPVVYRAAWALLVGHFVRTARQVKAVLYSVAGAGVALAAATAVAGLRAPAGEARDARATFAGHENFLAMFLIPCILIAAALLAQAARNRAWRLPAIKALLVAGGGGIALMLAVLLWCQSVGALVGLCAATAFLGVMLLPARRRPRAIAAGLGIVLVAGLVFALPGIRQRLFEDIVASRRHPAQATRYFYLIGSAHMFAARPLTGWGVGTFLSRYPQFRPTEAGLYGVMGHLSLHPHNEVMFVLLQYGLVGLALLGVALFLVFRRAWRNIPRNELRLPLLALMAGTGGMLVHSVFSVSLRFWGPATLFWTLTGVLLAVGRGAAAQAAAPEPATDAVPRPRSRTLTAAAAVVAVTAALAGVLWWQTCVLGLWSDHLILRAGDAAANAVRDYRAAIRLSRYNTDYVLTHGKLADVLEARGRYDQAEAVFHEARLIAPGLGPQDLRLGRHYEAEMRRVLGNDPAPAGRARQLALAHYAAYVRRWPYREESRTARRKLALLLRSTGPGRLPEAIAHLRWLVATQPTDLKARFMLAAALLDARRLDEAERLFADLGRRGREQALSEMAASGAALALARPLAGTVYLDRTYAPLAMAREAWRFAATAAAAGGRPAAVDRYAQSARACGLPETAADAAAADRAGQWRGLWPFLPEAGP